MVVTMNVVRRGGLRARAWSNCELHVGHGSCAINIVDRIPLAEAEIIVTLSALMVHCFQCHGILSRWISGVI